MGKIFFSFLVREFTLLKTLKYKQLFIFGPKMDKKFKNKGILCGVFTNVVIFSKKKGKNFIFSDKHVLWSCKKAENLFL